ncbi:Asp-tRNA(Asn)/Glu-tRNA(Gln) amidotransferase subunit GatC [Lachnospiraceae bacterium OttesenSCG-928-E19]|nr:Asp-tRNA(Asn)/Glu-tRNA(Gln) amidotransferase subunit GatC [Lachnospiraceae bacterium OttesenSCG-928-E19]
MLNNEIVEHISMLSKLELSEEEQGKVMKEMNQILTYIDKLQELDTDEVEPLTHISPMKNVFRQDMAVNKDVRDEMLEIAPITKDGQYVVPKTLT